MSQPTIEAILEDRRLVHAGPGYSVRQAAELMREHCCGSVAVLDDGRLVGLFTESDMVARVVAAGREPDATTLEEVMTREPATVAPGETVADAVRRMHECGFQHLPVVDGGKVLAMLSWRDLPLEHLTALAPELGERRALAERLR